MALDAEKLTNVINELMIKMVQRLMEIPFDQTRSRHFTTIAQFYFNPSGIFFANESLHFNYFHLVILMTLDIVTLTDVMQLPVDSTLSYSVAFHYYC